jgi:hypothetical protein
MDRIEEILKLAREGFRVFPLKPGTKIPAIEKWPELATTDEVQIRQWAGSFPGSNWGLACGKDSGVFVVDIDAKRGGLETWKKMNQVNGFPKTKIVATPHGGFHFYFKYPSEGEIRNANDLLPGIDIRGEGGYVVIPPSELTQ